MKRVEIKYFGLVAERMGREYEIRETALTTIAELQKEMESESFLLHGIPYRIAKNKKLVSTESPIEHGDELAFLPPFAGG